MEKILIIGATFFFRENSLLPLELEGTLNDRIYKCHLEMNRESDQDTVTESILYMCLTMGYPSEMT